MHRTTTLLLTAALLLAGGCGSSGDKPATRPSTSASPSASPTPLTAFMKSIADAELESYADGIPPFQELEVFPPQWCKALDEGHSVEWMLGDGGLYPVGQEWGTEKADAYQLVVLGVRAYCPKREAAVKDELRTSGEY